MVGVVNRMHINSDRPINVLIPDLWITVVSASGLTTTAPLDYETLLTRTDGTVELKAFDGDGNVVLIRMTQQLAMDAAWPGLVAEASR